MSETNGTKSLAATPILEAETDARVEDELWQAVLRRERGTGAATFVYGVKSTMVYCRAYCPSKRPNRPQVAFFRTAQEAEAAGYRPCLRCAPKADISSGAPLPCEQAVVEVCRILEGEYDKAPTLHTLAAKVGLSSSYLHRAFKQAIGVSPREYAAACRMERFRIALQSGMEVGEALAEAGYGSTSRIYEGRLAQAQLGAKPAVYRKERLKMAVRYSVVDCSYGRLLVAATEQGVCSVALGDAACADTDADADAGELLDALKREYPQALPLQRGDAQYEALTTAVAHITAHLSGTEPNLRLPLDVRATAFQRQVWQALQAIPYGETRSYSEVAAALGRPSAARAVAQACASNPVALVVPCHRVLRGDGDLSGYRWGRDRKAALLTNERGEPPA